MRDETMFIGVDGCPAGWAWVALDESGMTYGIAFKIDALWNQFSHASRILLDMPIGFPDSGSRACDLEARRRLGVRRNSVFAVPCRSALYAPDYLAANDINRQHSGVGLSKQSWNLAPKMREVDLFMQSVPAAREVIRESHPELVFWALAGGKPMGSSKKSDDGIQERVGILESLYPNADGLLQQISMDYPRAAAQPDDRMDALALAVGVKRCNGVLDALPANPPLDSKGLPMEMVYPSCAVA